MPPPSKCTSLYQTETLSPRLASTVVFCHFRFYLAKECRSTSLISQIGQLKYASKSMSFHRYTTRSADSLFDFRQPPVLLFMHLMLIKIETPDFRIKLSLNLSHTERTCSLLKYLKMILEITFFGSWK